MIANIKLSIVIPAYNAEKYIINTLMSIINQKVDFNYIEILIINDGSVDRTLELVKTFRDEFSNIKFNIYSKENGGLSDARNFGIKKAKGTYIWFFDADDIMEENSLSKIILKLNNGIDLLGFALKEIYYENNTIKIVNIRNRPIGFFVNGNDYIKRYNIGHSACCFIVKKSILIDNSIYFLKGVLSEDFDFELRLFEKCNNITHIEDVCYNYIIRNGSLSRRKNNDFYNFHHESMIKIIKNLDSHFNNSKNLDYKDSVEIYITRIKLIAIINLLKSTLPKYKVNYFLEEFKKYNFFELKNKNKIKLIWKHRLVIILIKYKFIDFFIFLKNLKP